MRINLPRNFVRVNDLALRSASRIREARLPAISNTHVLTRHRSSSTQIPPGGLNSDLNFRSEVWKPHTVKGFQPASKPQSFSNIQPQLAYIAFGSNLGDRVQWIEQACKEMSKRGVAILRTSSLWETDPMYVLDQDKFLNGVCEVKTNLGPIELLDTLQDIERSLGREKLIDKGPRNIDLDILLYGDEVVDHERLKIPHAGIFEREFVLRPLAELIPAKPINPSSPWKTTQDYLNAVTEVPSRTPMSTLTPLGRSSEPIRSLQSNRKTLIMKILNRSPESALDSENSGKKGHTHPGNIRDSIDLAIKHSVSILDIGGQSSAPETENITANEEIKRVVPFIELIRGTGGWEGLISIDTYRSPVAEAAVMAGADIINDISAGELDRSMLPTMARLGKTVCLMHMRGNPMTMQRLANYPDGIIETVARELLARVAEAEAAGIRRWRIILDPGIGFAKTNAHSIEILRRFDELRDWPGLRGLPWLVGTSRKKFIGGVIGGGTASKPHERDWGTAATVAAAIQGGADILRVHNARDMAEVAKVSDAIWRY
ncbi:Dihydropteroate synthase-like protein [Tricladium varicosporioides]|nr:Dihydropteroate synthase-like protein [Hymenoscyphus varicosporioides]